MNSLKSYLPRSAYAAAKAEKLRREAAERQRWWDNLVPQQFATLVAAETWDDFLQLLRRFNYPGVPGKTVAAADVEEWLYEVVSTEQFPMEKLPTAILEEIVYGRDPEMRERSRAWWRGLSNDQEEALRNASSEEAERLMRAWGYPDLDGDVLTPTLSNST